MNRFIRKYLYTILAGITYLIIHEGVHIIQAMTLDIYEGIRLLPLGIEVEILQPLTIEGLELAAFSGLSSIVTVLIGYFLLLFSPNIIKFNNQLIKNYLYYITFVFLLLDPIYMSVLSFFVGGDINGIVLGLNISYMSVRSVYFVIAILNSYLVYKKLYPTYVIK